MKDAKILIFVNHKEYAGCANVTCTAYAYVSDCFWYQKERKAITFKALAILAKLQTTKTGIREREMMNLNGALIFSISPFHLQYLSRLW